MQIYEEGYGLLIDLVTLKQTFVTILGNKSNTFFKIFFRYEIGAQCNMKRNDNKEK